MAVSEGEREGVERWRNQEGLASEATYWKPHAITAHCRWRAATDTTDGQKLQADLGYKPGVMTQGGGISGHSHYGHFLNHRTVSFTQVTPQIEAKSLNFLPLSFLQKDIWELTGSVRFIHNRANIKLIQYLNNL